MGFHDFHDFLVSAGKSTPKVMCKHNTQTDSPFWSKIALHFVGLSTCTYHWRRKQADGGKELPGNDDNDNQKTNKFDTPFVARYVRFLPTSWSRIFFRESLRARDRSSQQRATNSPYFGYKRILPLRLLGHPD